MRKDTELNVHNKDRHEKCSVIKKQIAILQEDLRILQEECNHSEKILKFGESNNVYKYCRICYKQIGYPNESELRNHGFK